MPKTKLQTQYKISSKFYNSKKLSKNSENNCFFIMKDQEKEFTIFCKNYHITDHNNFYGTKNQPFYKLVVKNNITIKAEKEIFVENLIISNNCVIKLDYCQLSITKLILIDDDKVQENFNADLKLLSGKESALADFSENL